MGHSYKVHVVLIWALFQFDAFAEGRRGGGGGGGWHKACSACAALYRLLGVVNKYKQPGFPRVQVGEECQYGATAILEKIEYDF